MGAMNKHPSCKITWERTTKASCSVSMALASLMESNVHLECILLAEFTGQTVNEDHLSAMVTEARESRRHLLNARDHITASIEIGEKNGNPYQGDFRAIEPRLLAELWDQCFLADCKGVVNNLGEKLKGDHLSTARSFVIEIDALTSMMDSVIATFETATEFARSGALKQAIEDGDFPLQVNFAVMFSRFMAFMKEYLVDSLIATEVVFISRGKSLLAS
jgi:hypothetical protein